MHQSVSMTFSSHLYRLSPFATLETRATEQYFPVVLVIMLYIKAILTLGSMGETMYDY